MNSPPPNAKKMKSAIFGLQLTWPEWTTDARKGSMRMGPVGIRGA